MGIVTYLGVVGVVFLVGYAFAVATPQHVVPDWHVNRYEGFGDRKLRRNSPRASTGRLTGPTT